nr:MAG TPA: hypothetical protein [Caudoviricetes sp.]
MFQVVDENALIGQKRDEPDDLVNSHLKVFALHELISKVLQTAIATGDLFGGSGGEDQFIVHAADIDNCAAFCIHAKSSLHRYIAAGKMNRGKIQLSDRFIHLIVPAVNDRLIDAFGAFSDFGFPRVLAECVQFVSTHDRALDGRRGEGDAVALGGEVGGRDAELYTVQPVIPVFAVRFLRTEAHGHRIAAVLGSRNDDAVCIDGGAGEITGHRCADIVHTEGKRTGFELLHDFRCAVIRIKGGFVQLDREVSRHSLCQDLRGGVGFIAVVILGDLGVEKFIKTDCCHWSYLHFIVFGHIHGVVVIAGFSFVSVVQPAGDGEIITQQEPDQLVLGSRITAGCKQRQPRFLHIDAGCVIRMKVEGIGKRNDDEVLFRGLVGEDAGFHGDVHLSKGCL